MNRAPAYFDAIRDKTSQRWDKLEQDPELAGPWHQLFKQVQSPRHILSELLQNADDAGATEASVRIEDHVFIFEHNGEDFTEEHFASLCRFGYSNKRALHTIGFRGIGFKSTFSLGDTVELFTPTLAVSFDRKRFTQPRWVPDEARRDSTTLIRVKIKDNRREEELAKNLEEWLTNPVSLLFFRNIRRILIADRDVHWGSFGPGPIPDSEWMALYENDNDIHLLVRSSPEAFPEDALAEIHQERMLGDEEVASFPPCKVEIVLGAAGRLYVVLPTGVETALPFACNAPFIQDPARLKIKDPETSPTNRWLLNRVGQLAASAMLRWLRQSESAVAERAAAYELLPDLDLEDNSLEGVCGATVEESFRRTVEGKPLLLTETGELALPEECIRIPTELVDIWPPEQGAALFDDKARPPLSRHVSEADSLKLRRWGILEEIDKVKILSTLQSQRPSKPSSWNQLLDLWAYVAPDVSGYRRTVSAKELRIIPVHSYDCLYSAAEVVRLGEKRLLQSPEDWQFLGKYLTVLNQNWLRFLAEQRRVTADESNASGQRIVEAAYEVLQETGLGDPSDVDTVIDRVAGVFFVNDGVGLEKGVQLAQIAAKLAATAGSSFRYATRDNVLQPVALGIFFDEDGSLERLLPGSKTKARLLHVDYTSHFTSCSKEEWLEWITSGRAGLLTFVPPAAKNFRLHGRKKIELEAVKRGVVGELSYPYVTSDFVVEDWDFDDEYWRHWTVLASKDDGVWAEIGDEILAQRDAYWGRSKSARLLQVATTSSVRPMYSGPVIPKWALRLRDLPCLRDTRGIRRKPDELLRRTPETEPLMDVEPFVDGYIDTERTRALLDILGVRSTPTGPARLLDCLRALAQAENPPVHEVDRWYRRLDQMIDTCSTEDAAKIKEAFGQENLIRTNEGSFATASTVFLSSDEEAVPGAPVVTSTVSDLTIWRKIGVADRPTADRAIEWLNGLASGQPLSPEDVRRVRALIARYPIRIWEECNHWLNLSNEWAPIKGLSYALTMQALIPWGHLHPWVKQKTADFQRLPVEVTATQPFSGLPALAHRLEERFDSNPLTIGMSESREWMRVLGSELRRVILETEAESARIRALGEALAATRWHATMGLDIVPYIAGTPAGTPRRADLVWLGKVLYVDQLPKAKLAKRVPEELGKVFARSDIKVALDYSFERSAEDVRAYLEENFDLAPESAVKVGTEIEIPASEAPVSLQSEALRENLGLDDLNEAENRSQTSPLDHATEELPENDETISQQQSVESHRTMTSKRARPTIIERFALSQGFRKESNELFVRPDGSRIARGNEHRVLWERRNSAGDVVRFLWPKDHCLESEPLHLEAEIWALLDQHPKTYALVLSNPEGGTVEFTGFQLRAMRDEGRITLYPSAYRLVHSSDNHD